MNPLGLENGAIKLISNLIIKFLFSHMHLRRKRHDKKKFDDCLLKDIVEQILMNI